MIGLANAFRVRCTPAEGGAVYIPPQCSTAPGCTLLTWHNVKHGRPHDGRTDQPQLWGGVQL